MSDLYPLFVHGGLLCGLALVALPLVAARAVFRRRARRLAAGSRLVLRRLPRPAPEIPRQPDSDVCVDGVLAGPEGARVYGWTGREAREVEGGLVLRVGAEELPLVGPVEILAGARESAPGSMGRLARTLRILCAPADLTQEGRALLLGPGDRVRVHGRVGRLPEASSYREAKGGLSIEPLPAEGVIRAAALAAPRLVAWPIEAWGAGALLGAAIWAAIFVIGGKLAMQRALDRWPGTEEGTRWSPAAFAAATVYRTEALRLLADNLAIDVRYDPLERRMHAREVYRLLGDCTGRCAVEHPGGDWEGAVACAEACGGRPPADALFAAGRFDEASDAYRDERMPDPESPERALRRAEAHLIARRWSQSAEAVVAYQRASHDPDPDREVALGCLEVFIRGLPHREQAARQVWSQYAPCKVLAADATPRSARDYALGDLELMWRDSRGMDFAKTLAIRTARALLVEGGLAGAPALEVYEDDFVPELYLARNDPASSPGRYPPGAARRFYESGHLADHPWAIYAAMIAEGRGDARDPLPLRLQLVGHTALFLAATGDAEGAREALAKLADVGDPRVEAIAAAVEELGREQPARLRGALYGALDDALERVRSARGHVEASRAAVGRLRAAALERPIAVPLHLLEAFARRKELEIRYGQPFFIK